jgi:hypothetical protein
VSDRGGEPESGDLDTTGEPEPDWADRIRAGRRERAERLRRLLEPSEEPPVEPPP